MIDLPFYKYTAPIAKAIKENDVTVICLSTGSGKSIGCPNIALETTGKRSIMVSNPTIMAVRELCKFQRSLQNDMSIPRIVDYAAGGDVRYNRQSNIVYVTTGHLNKRIIQSLSQLKTEEDWMRRKAIDFTDIVMVDECHHRSKENYVLMYLLRYILKKQPTLAPKIIIASATVGIEDIKEVFREFKPCFLNFEHPKFPIEMNFHSKDYPVFNADEERFDAAVRLCTKIVSEQEGDILIFCSGSVQVESMITRLHTDKRTNECLILRCYASCSDEEMAMVTTPFDPALYKRKIIVSTNVAESSVTIDGVVHVIDLMLEKIVKTDASGTVALCIQHITRSSSIQRAGRAGRTAPGVYHALCTEKFYRQLPALNTSEFYRNEIYSTVIEFLDAGIDAETILNIPKRRYQQTLGDLLQLKMIKTTSDTTEDSPEEESETCWEDSSAYDTDESSSTSDSDSELFRDDFNYRETQIVTPKKPIVYEVTEAGRFCPKLPVFLRNAYWIHLILQREGEEKESEKDPSVVPMLDLAVILISMLEVIASQPIVWIPKRDREESTGAYQERITNHKVDYFDRFYGANDFETLLNIYFCMLQESLESQTLHKRAAGNSKGAASPVFCKRWSTENSMNNRVLVQISHRVKRLCEALGMKNRIQTWSQPTCMWSRTTLNQALKIFMEAYPDHVCTQVITQKRGPIKFRDPKGSVFGINNRNHMSNICIADTQKLCCYVKSHVQTNTGSVFSLLNYIFEVLPDSVQKKMKEREFVPKRTALEQVQNGTEEKEHKEEVTRWKPKRGVR
jgi:hypothetical protein